MRVQCTAMSVKMLQRKLCYVFLLFFTCVFWLYIMIRAVGISRATVGSNDNSIEDDIEQTLNKDHTRDARVIQTPESDFRKRILKIKNFCQSEEHKKDLPGEVRHVLTSEKLRLIYCVIPKAGCTFWKRIFTVINEKKDNGSKADIFSIPRQYVHAPGLSQQSYDATLHGPGKFPYRLLVARDPFTRVLSSYLDKLYLPDFWYTTGARFTSMFRDKPKWMQMLSGNTSRDDQGHGRSSSAAASLNFMEAHYLAVHLKFDQPEVASHTSANGVFSCGKYVTFSEYVMAAMFDEEPHWMTSYQLCDPCQFQPTHVIYMDTFTEDSRSLLSHLGLSHLISHLDIETRISEEMDMLVDYHFHQVFQSELSDFYRRCVTPQELAFRLWQTFIWKGYLLPHTAPTLSRASSDAEVKRHLLNEIKQARREALKETVLLENSKMNYHDLFRSTLTSGVYKQLIRKFEIDYKVFDQEVSMK